MHESKVRCLKRAVLYYEQTKGMGWYEQECRIGCCIGLLSMSYSCTCSVCAYACMGPVHMLEP